MCEQSNILEETQVGQILFNPRLYYSYAEEIIISTGKKQAYMWQYFVFLKLTEACGMHGFVETL